MSNKIEALGSLDRELAARQAAKYDVGLETQALDWIAALTGKSKPDGMTVHDFLKDGMVLCETMNAIKPNAISKFQASKMAFKMMENINKFLDAAVAYGVPKTDVFQTVDLYEEKNMNQVIISIHALGREAQRKNFTGPSLGVKPSEQNIRNFDEETLNAGKYIASAQMGNNKGASQKGMSAPGATREIDHVTHATVRESRNAE